MYILNEYEREDNHAPWIHYYCNEGYSLRGNQSASCQMDGTWSSQTPTCVTSTISVKITNTTTDTTANASFNTFYASIAGGGIGGVILLLIIVGVIIVVRRRSSKR